jgi:type III secretion protein R
METSPLLTIVVLGGLSLLPFAFMVSTSFVKLSVVFSILRNALGTGQVPSGMVVAALSALLTIYVMVPVGQQMMAAAEPALARVDRENPFLGESGDAVFEALTAAVRPLATFLDRNAGDREQRLFLDLARSGRQTNDIEATDVLVVMPAFLVTELTEAFLIGFLVFIPFLVVDMVIANVLLALGMHMLSPTTISLPFKLLLFVLVDGWYLLAHALVAGYA